MVCGGIGALCTSYFLSQRNINDYLPSLIASKVASPQQSTEVTAPTVQHKPDLGTVVAANHGATRAFASTATHAPTAAKAEATPKQTAEVSSAQARTAAKGLETATHHPPRRCSTKAPYSNS